MSDEGTKLPRPNAWRFRRLRKQSNRTVLHNDFRLDFVELLEAIMAERSMTAADVATELRLPVGMVERWLSGEDDPGLTGASVYLEHLGIKAKIQIV